MSVFPYTLVINFTINCTYTQGKAKRQIYSCATNKPTNTYTYIYS